MYYDIITKGRVTTDNKNGETCLFGKLEWNLNHEDSEIGIIKHSKVTVVFDRLECIKAMEFFKDIKEISREEFEYSRKYYIVNEIGLKIHVSDDTEFKHFQKAIRHLFGFVISEMADSGSGIKVKVNVSTDNV